MRPQGCSSFLRWQTQALAQFFIVELGQELTNEFKDLLRISLLLDLSRQFVPACVYGEPGALHSGNFVFRVRNESWIAIDSGSFESSIFQLFFSQASRISYSWTRPVCASDPGRCRTAQRPA